MIRIRGGLVMLGSVLDVPGEADLGTVALCR